MTRTNDRQAPDTGRRPAMTPTGVLINALRGALMGLAELVPGVSGGTIALVTGVYERIIDSAHHVVTAFRTLVTGPDRLRGSRTELARVEWTLIIPLLLGMGATILTMAGIMKNFVEGQPELSKGLFLGMVAASVIVPLLLVDPRDLREGAPRVRLAGLFVVVAVAAFLLTSLGGGVERVDPPKLLVFVAAAVAICALVLPGISGSFLLLVLGLYTTTTGAVDELDLGYIGVFAAGATLGLALFVKGLHWLLHHHHTTVMVAMAGLMLGSLRALWPWQDARGGVLAPANDWPLVLLLTVVGAVAVLGLVAADRKVSAAQRRAAAEPVHP